MTDTPDPAPAPAEAPAAQPYAVPPSGAYVITDPGDASPIGWNDGVPVTTTDFRYAYGITDPVSGLPILHTVPVVKTTGLA